MRHWHSNDKGAGHRATGAWSRTLPLLLLALIMLPLRPHARAQAEQTAYDVTEACAVSLPGRQAGNEPHVLDGNVESYATLEHSNYVEIALPTDGAGYLCVSWYDLPEAYTVEQYDATGTLLGSDEAQGFINDCYELDEAARSLHIYVPRDARLADLRVFSAGELPAQVQRWQATPQTADLLLIASTPQAAAQDLYAVVASYTVEHGVSTRFAVLERDTRTAQEELLNALWYLGVRTYPIFYDLVCNNNDSYKLTKGEWNAGATIKLLASLINASGARVLATHAANESAYNASAQFTGEMVDDALKRLDDEANERLLKAYRADINGATVLELNEPLIAFDGQTVMEVANAAYMRHASLTQFHKSIQPTAAFTLSYTRVGGDALGDNLLENIDTTSLIRYIEPTPSPTPSPEPTPTAAPTEPPDEANAQSAQDVPPHAKPGDGDRIARIMRFVPVGIIALGLIACIVVGLTGYRRIAARFSTARALFCTILPLLIATMLLGLFLLLVKPALARRQEAAQQTLQQRTPAPTPTPTPTAASEGSPAPETEAPETEAPEPEAQQEDARDNPYGENDGGVNDNQFYRSPDDPEEVILVDNEAGHWEYRTDTLSILIDRHLVTEPKENAIFIAHIRMRGVNAFRTLQAAENRNGMGALRPWQLARQGKAVLLITGDNIIESDDVYKGIMIRDGIVFQDRRAVNCLAMYPDMTMRIHPENSVNAQDLLEAGVRDVFSFGPTLIEDGEINEKAAEHRLSRRNNPRTGLGMVEPGHFVAIVCDGRQAGYSLGMKLDEFAQLFVEEGCPLVYNLDGGLSACMLFMGEQLNSHGNKKEGEITDSYQRRVPDGLVWGYSEQVPDEDDPIYNTGSSKK